MNVFQFLNNRQFGTNANKSFEASSPRLNFDNVLSRLICKREDVFTVRGEEGDVPPFSCKFRRDAQSDLLAVANEDGDIALYDTAEITQEPFLSSFSAHHNAIFDLCWLPDKCQLISGSGDHNATLWDITHCKRISVFEKHSASVKTVDVCYEQSAVFATGSRDGSINVWDTRANVSANRIKPVINITFAHCRKNFVPNMKKMSPKDPISSVSSVVFQDCHHLASSGAADGVVKIWDLRKTYVQNSKYLPSPKYLIDYSDSKHTGRGCTSLVFDSQHKNLYGCSTSNKIFRLDCHSYSKEVVAWYEGFRCATYFVKLALSFDDQYLLCGSSNDKAYIWKVSNPGYPILQLPGHSAEVTSVSWSPHDITKLATCGDDNKIAIWKIATSDTISDSQENVHAIAETFSECPKNSSPTSPDSGQNSITPSNTSTTRIVKKSPIAQQTPSRPASRVITNFFSPVTPVMRTPVKDIQNTIAENANVTKNPIQKMPNMKSPSTEMSSQVLTPSNHINKSNIMQQSLNDNSETQSSPTGKTSTIDFKNSGPSVLTSSTSIQNKENTNIDLSPETVNKTNNAGQGKRKSPSQSTPNLKRKLTDSSSKSKRPTKNAKKSAPPGRTIMNYFTVVLSPDN